jgi:leucyl-tRNA synthetase
VAEASESYLEGVMADINEILKVTGIMPRKVFIYTTPQWKRDVLSAGLSLVASKSLTIPGLTKVVMAQDDLKRRGKESADFARKMAEDLMKSSESDIARLSMDLDENAYLLDSSTFLARELGCEVAIYPADDPSAPDPQKKARAAQPHRPAIYIR